MGQWEAVEGRTEGRGQDKGKGIVVRGSSRGDDGELKGRVGCQHPPRDQKVIRATEAMEALEAMIGGEDATGWASSAKARVLQALLEGSVSRGERAPHSTRSREGKAVGVGGGIPVAPSNNEVTPGMGRQTSGPDVLQQLGAESSGARRAVDREDRQEVARV